MSRVTWSRCVENVYLSSGALWDIEKDLRPGTVESEAETYQYSPLSEM